MKKLSILLALLLPAAPAGLAAWTGQAADTHIGYPDGNDARLPAAVMDGQGTIHVFWLEFHPSGFDREVHTGRSTDGGVTWSSSGADQLVSYPDAYHALSGGYPAAAVGPADQLFVIWPETADNGFDKYLHGSGSSDGGITWSGAAQDIVVGVQIPGAAFTGDLTYVDSEHLVVVYEEDPTGAESEIYCALSSDGGATWAPPVAGARISASGQEGRSRRPSLAADPAGVLHAVWMEYVVATGDHTVHHAASSDDGETWGAITSVTGLWPAVIDTPWIVCGPDGHLNVVFCATDHTSAPFYHDVYYSRSTDGGITWSGVLSDTPIGIDTDDSTGAPRLAVDSCGYLHAVWHETLPGSSKEILYSLSTDSGATWSGTALDLPVSFPDGDYCYNPALTIGPADAPFVFWYEPAGADSEIHVSLQTDPPCQVEPPDVPAAGPGGWLLLTLSLTWLVRRSRLPPRRV